MEHNIIDFVIGRDIRSNNFLLNQFNNKLSLGGVIGLFNRFTLRWKKLKHKNMYRFELIDNSVKRSLDVRIIHQTDTRRHDIGSTNTYFIDNGYDIVIFINHFSDTIFELLDIPLVVKVAHPIHGLIETNVSPKDIIFNKYFSQKTYNVDGAVYLIDGFNNAVIDSINKSIKREKVLYQHDRMELERRHKERLSMLENAKNEIINSINI